ncbi:MAG TPA: glycoside hydrolase family 125 protein, partial [Candidatus Eremiobacteraceae bacterium]|nr:glycoside hydrolase family 125 protein [Candidatus Eremiobacteraceae bacterium]
MRKLIAAIAGTFAITMVAAQSSTIADRYHRAGEVNAACFFRAPDHTTYVSTGDINAMWLRDSSVQAMSLLRADRDLVRGVILRQERMIRSDPYANAFHQNYIVAERKFEIDSLCYPVKLAERYVYQTGDTTIYDASYHATLVRILNTLSTEQRHADASTYHRNEHPSAKGTGLIWSAYRPSDDPVTYNFNVPENAFAAVTLRDMAHTFSTVYNDDDNAGRALIMAQQIEAAIGRLAVMPTGYGRMYAYEIDGLGHAKFMDDANMPSLLSMPLTGFVYDAQAYKNTRAFVLSPGNPYYYHGRYAEGVGSPHTPANFVWPMSLVVQYRTATGEPERGKVVRELVD